MPSISITIDTTVHAAYVRLSDGAVDHTVQFNDQILVDMDVHNVVVGIEILDEAAPLPFTELARDFHVHSDVVALLRLIRPNVSAFLEFAQGTDGATAVRPATELQPA